MVIRPFASLAARVRGRVALATCLLALFALTSVAAVPARATNPTSETGAAGMADLQDALFQLSPDLERVATVKGLHLQRDVIVFELRRGEMALAKPVVGRVCAAYFAGQGRVRFTPAQPVEREQLRLRLGTPQLDLEIVSVVFLFADSTAEEMAAALAFGPGRFKYVRPTSAENLRDLVDAKLSYVEPALARPLLEGWPSRFFAAVVITEDGQRLRFQIDPNRTEEVSFHRVGDGGASPTFTVSRFRLDGAPSDSLDRDERQVLAIRSYRIDITLTSGLTPHYVVDMGCEVQADSVRHLPLQLEGIEVAPDSVHTYDGQPCRVTWNRARSLWVENSQLWVDLGRSRKKGERFRLHMRYRGLPMGDLVGLPFQHSRANWYPVAHWQNRSFFDITYHYSRPLQVVSVGDSISTEVDAQGRVTSRWRTPEPIRLATWHIGELALDVTQPEGLPEIRIVSYGGSHERTGWAVKRSAGVNPGKVQTRPVAGDLIHSLRFFQDTFGPLSLVQLHAMESYEVHGEAYAGMLRLGWTTFHGTDNFGNDDLLRAHEVAHQWWGISVEPKTYRDRWLSEGLSEFCALWYMQAKRNDTALYLKTLSYSRERLLEATDVVSPWLGARGAEMHRGNDAYVSAVYLKGAWVMHMLRMMLIDADALDDSRLKGLLHDFAQRYAGREASTRDFARLAAAHAGEPMDWFFDQWIHGTAIPRYRYDWRYRKGERGEHLVTLRVEQSGVPDGFRMPVLVRLDCAGGEVARTRIWVDQPVVEVTFSPLPSEPRHLEFNEFSAVLCRAERLSR